MKTFRSSVFLVFVVSILFMLVVSSGCKHRLPTTFIQTMEPSWISIELRDDITDEKAWNSILDTLIKRFDIEVMEKENGYIRTVWKYTWTGVTTPDYRVRAIVKFKKDARKVDVKTDAEYDSGKKGEWVVGYDTRLVETLKTDIMGSIGRTTR